MLSRTYTIVDSRKELSNPLKSKTKHADLKLEKKTLTKRKKLTKNPERTCQKQQNHSLIRFSFVIGKEKANCMLFFFWFERMSFCPVNLLRAVYMFFHF